MEGFYPHGRRRHPTGLLPALSTTINKVFIAALNAAVFVEATASVDPFNYVLPGFARLHDVGRLRPPVGVAKIPKLIVLLNCLQHGQNLPAPQPHR